jgi:hypothetical protein
LGARSVSSSTMVADTDMVNFLKNHPPPLLNVPWNVYKNRALIRTIDDNIPSGLNSSARQQSQGPLWKLELELTIDIVTHGGRYRRG